MDEGARVWIADPADGRVWRPARVVAERRPPSPAAVTVEYEDEWEDEEEDDGATESDGEETERGKTGSSTKPTRAVIPLTFKAVSHTIKTTAGDDAGECANVLPRNAAGQQDQADLVSLPHLHEASILHALRLRYARHAIYTHIGEILISVNPFEKLPALYTRAHMERYSPDSALGLEADDLETADPHLFGVARAAYVDVARNARNQSILISGESGAGKTEATKIVMKYFALTCGQSSSPPTSTASFSASTSTKPTASIETQVLQSNPILESFGNARTVRNDNSSRFGKFIELQFDPRGPLTLRGARIRTYLLEKIRVIQQACHERNFHIFYELLAALGRSVVASPPTEEDEDDQEDVELVSSLLATLSGKRREWGLRDAGQFRLLNQSECMKRRDGVEDGAQFRRTLRAMEQLGLTEAEISSVLEIVTAVLHMGNVEFAETVVRRKNSRNRSISESDRDADIIHATTTVKVVRVNPLAREEDEDEDHEEDDDDEPMDHFAKAAALLGVEPEQLERALTRRWLHTANETLEVALDVGHAENTRNALAMECYRLLFEWLVGRINAKIHPDARKSTSRSLSRENSVDGGDKMPEQELTIGLLDIFGFEDMATNSFEQLCINYANEALQHQFNEFVFASEQRLYREEGIFLHDGGGDGSNAGAMSLDGMEFPDNSACLELFEKKPLGLFSLTDQECVFPQGTDRALVAKLYSAFAGGDPTTGSQSQQQHLMGRSRASSTTIGTHTHFVMASALQRSTHFAVAHYAGRVLYTAEGFLAKNKDAFCESAVLLLAQSRNPLIQALAISSTATATARAVAASSSTTTGGARRPAVRRANSSIAATSVGTQFKLQLNELLDIIRATTPHYVRCIKPNDSSSSGAFDTRRVVEQLRSGGVLEAVRVARAGFPVRLSHEQFLERYRRILLGCRVVVHLDSLHVADDVHTCLDRLTRLLEKQQEQAKSTAASSLASGVRLGHTRVFFRRKPFEALEKLRTSVRSSAAVVIQTQARGFTARHRYRSLLRTVLVIQCLYRGHCARLVTHSVRGNVRATTIQRFARGFCARRSFSKLKTTAIMCQSFVRMKRSKRIVQTLREHRAVTRLAAAWRRRFALRSFRRMQSAVLAVQCALRSRIARRELLELKRESRNIDKLKEDNSALKSELAALRAQLEAMQLQQQPQLLGHYGVLPTPVLNPLQAVMVASVLIPAVIAPAADKEQVMDAKIKRAGGAASDAEPQVDQEPSQQEDEADYSFEEEEEDETSMSIPSFAYQTPGSDSCEESNNNQLQNDCALVAGSRAASTASASACASLNVVGSACTVKVEGDMVDDHEMVETGEDKVPPVVEAEPAIEAVHPEQTPSKALRSSVGRPRRFSLPDIPSTFSLTSTPCNTARAATKPTTETEDVDDDLDELDDLVTSPSSRDRRRSLDLWLARQEHVEEELQQLREEVRATALAVASASTSAAPTPTAEDQKEVMKKYVASQIKAKMVRLQLQPPSSPCLRLDLPSVDNNSHGSDLEDDGAAGDDEADMAEATRQSTKWRAPASVGYSLSRPANSNARLGGGVTPRRRLDAISRVAKPLTERSRSDALPQHPPSSSSCYAQRARNARTAWNFSGAASVAKPQSAKHSRGLQAYFADDDASDDEFDDFGNGTLRLRRRELQLPTRSASVGLPPLRGGFEHCDAGADDGRQPVIATAWTPVRTPRVAQGLVPRWTKDAACNECHCTFGLLVRRHHCRQCGHSFCYEHSTRKLRLPHFGYAEPQRVCDACFEAHLRGLSSCPSGSPYEASGWMRKRREASMALARAAATPRKEEDEAAVAKMMGTPRMTRRDTETSSVDSLAVSAM